MVRALEARLFRVAAAVGVLVRRWAWVAALWVCALPGRASAQLPQAEDAFVRGDYKTARQLYQQVLAIDSLNPRALFRLAQLDSWDGKLKESLARYVILRRVEPVDPDIKVSHAQVLSWDGQTTYAVALYDSVLAEHPERTDALAGRARAVAWSGDLNRAERLWRDALAKHPDDAEILTGLAQTLYWMGQTTAAEPYLVRARQVAPEDKTARDLLSVVRATTRPVVNASIDDGGDSDDNRFFLLNGSYAWSFASGTRGTVHAGWRRATDPFRAGSSVGIDAFAVKSLKPTLSLRAGAGVSRLSPDSGSGFTPLTLQLGVGLRPSETSSIGLSYSRAPFDETALLITKGYVWDEVEATADLTPKPDLDLFGTGDVAWLSDGNRRLIGALGAMTGIGRGVHVGGYGRLMGYQQPYPGRGYFAPENFWMLESRAVYNWRRTVWAARADAGLGAQNVGSGAATQAEWHVGLTASRTWRAIDELSLVGLYTNSAAARTGTATTSSYRYWSVGLRYRRGL